MVLSDHSPSADGPRFSLLMDAHSGSDTTRVLITITTIITKPRDVGRRKRDSQRTSRAAKMGHVRRTVAPTTWSTPKPRAPIQPTPAHLLCDARIWSRRLQHSGEPLQSTRLASECGSALCRSQREEAEVGPSTREEGVHEQLKTGGGGRGRVDASAMGDIEGESKKGTERLREESSMYRRLPATAPLFPITPSTPTDTAAADTSEISAAMCSRAYTVMKIAPICFDKTLT